MPKLREPIIFAMKTRLSRVPNWEKLARDSKFQPAVMAARCTVSLRHLERFFAEHFKTTPRRWTRELRCGIARRLIAEGWLNKAVVDELGFADESHLCHEFKTFYGVSPQTFAPICGAAPPLSITVSQRPITGQWVGAQTPRRYPPK